MDHFPARSGEPVHPFPASLLQIRGRGCSAVDGARNVCGAGRSPLRRFAALDFGAGVGPGNFARERVHLFGQNGIRINGQAQGVAKRVSRRPSATFRSFRAGAGPSVCAVCLDLARASHIVP